jgi:hypothetical protein
MAKVTKIEKIILTLSRSEAEAVEAELFGSNDPRTASAWQSLKEALGR